MNSPEAVKSRDRAAAFEQEAKQLREQYREQRVAAQAQGEKASVGVAKEAGVEKTAPPLMVVDKRNGNRQILLTEFVKDVPKPQLAKDFQQHRIKQRRGQTALDEIGAALKSGKPLDADDVRHLPRHDLDQIKQRGDQHLRERVQQHEQARSNPKTQGKELER